MKFLKNNKKFLFGLILGLLISAGSVYAIDQINSLNVIYDNTTSGLTSTNVQGAIDELYQKSNTWLNVNDGDLPISYSFTDGEWVDDPLELNKKIYYAEYIGAVYGICFYDGESQHCFKMNDVSVVKKQFLNYFDEEECFTHGVDLSCNGNDLSCKVKKDGSVQCSDDTSGEWCMAGGSNDGCH